MTSAGAKTSVRGRVLVTGANGFVGSALVLALRARGWQVHAAVRTPESSRDADREILIASVDDAPGWARAVRGVDCVVHLAARVHVMHDAAANPLSAFRQANVEGTRALAHAAAQAGVRRLVFLSSIKVNGESTTGRAPFTENDPPAPVDPYGVSKREAEDVLLGFGRDGPMEIVVIRPPLIYGPGVKANFRVMMRWLQRGIPLPLGSIHNRRTLVGLDNLVDLIATCLVHSSAANQVFLAGDGDDVSTTELLRRLAVSLGVPARLVPVPAPLLEVAAALLGKSAVAQRLCGNLQVDISKARRILAWTPPVPVDEGLRRTAAHFLLEREL